jgi:glycosyltransferase involved in cell wall biosynthesis
MSCVDVVIPCYKYGHYLRGCVESVLSQDGVEVRVLILDDCSPDNTPEVAAELVRKDSRVEYRRHTVNQGHIATYNEGLEWASGTYVLLLSADDMLTPGALGRAVRFLDARPEVGMVCGREIHISSELVQPEVESIRNDYQSRVIPGIEYLELSCRNPINHVSTPTAVIRTELQKKLGGYRTELPHAGDMEMWMRIAVHAALGFLDVPQGFYRLHGQNMSARDFGNALADLRQREAAFATLFREQGEFIPDCERLQKLVAANLANQVRQCAEDTFWAASRAFDRGDVEGCRELLQDAAEAAPELTSSVAWWRMRVKRVLGPRLWSVLRIVLDGIRGRKASNPAVN